MTETRVILITGSRAWTDERVFFTAVDQAFTEFAAGMKGASGWQVIVRHGACPRGADAIAASYVRIRKMIWHENVAEDPHPADWNAHGKRAGYLRNELMVSLGADLCIGFVMPCILASCSGKAPHGTHGTEHCLKAAAKAGIPARRITP